MKKIEENKEARLDKTLLICERMQKDLDKLKKLNFTMSSRYENICIFDNDLGIKPSAIDHIDNHGEEVIFSFDCAHYKK